LKEAWGEYSAGYKQSNEKLGKQLDSSDRFVGGDLHEIKRN